MAETDPFQFPWLLVGLVGFLQVQEITWDDSELNKIFSDINDKGSPNNPGRWPVPWTLRDVQRYSLVSTKNILEDTKRTFH